MNKYIQQVFGAYASNIKYGKDLPPHLEGWYVYMPDSGHCIVVILKQHQEEAFNSTSTDPAGFLVPVPIRSIFRSGYKCSNGFIIADLEYDPELGVVVQDEDYEFVEDCEMAFSVVQVGQPMPEPILSSLKAARQEERTFCRIGTNGGIEMFIILKNPTNKELEEAKGSLTIIFQNYDLPFLVVKYKSMSFDAPLLKQSSPMTSNSLTIYFIDLNDYVVKSMRLLGLNPEMTKNFTTGFASILKEADKAFLSYVQKIYAEYTPEQMCEGGVRQIFER